VRRIAVLVVGAVMIASCAAPEIRLSPRFHTGEVRDYRLKADAEITIKVQGPARHLRSSLDADTKLEVTSVEGGITSITLTVTPRTLTRDGKPADLGPPQEVRMKVDPTGRVTEVTTGEDAGSREIEGAEVEDLIPLIGPPAPAGPVHLADHWARAPIGAASPIPTGTVEARLAALSVSHDLDCAVVSLSTHRPVSRRQTVGGVPLSLQGTEYAAGEIAFAFREGFPVSVSSDSEARLSIAGGPPGSGVVLLTKTAITLVRRRLPASS
jgi:hypothetical protein